MWVDLSQAVAPTPIPTLPSRAFSSRAIAKKIKALFFLIKSIKST